MPTTEMIVTVAGGLFILLAFIQLLRLISSMIRYRTIRAALLRDPAAAASLIDCLREPDNPGQGDDRTAVILIAIGIAMIGASFTAGDTGGWTDYGIGGALFPLLVGAALWLRHYFVERARRRDQSK